MMKGTIRGINESDPGFSFHALTKIILARINEDIDNILQGKKKKKNSCLFIPVGLTCAQNIFSGQYIIVEFEY